MTRPALPWLLGANGGYVDAISYLALHGLFAAHVTGNFVTLGAALVHGSGGALGKLLALPVFGAVIGATRWISGPHAPTPSALGIILACKVLLLAAAAGCALRFGPFEAADGWAPLATGMLLVAAMAIQNALGRIHLSQLPPSTVMTGNVTQLMVDIADLGRGIAAEQRDKIRARTQHASGRQHLRFCGRLRAGRVALRERLDVVLRATAGAGTGHVFPGPARRAGGRSLMRAGVALRGARWR